MTSARKCNIYVTSASIPHLVSTRHGQDMVKLLSIICYIVACIDYICYPFVEGAWFVDLREALAPILCLTKTVLE